MIDAELLKQVRRIQVRTRLLVTDVFAGGYTSTFKGSGIEFEEVREFSEGDDLRAVDWNVTARAGRPFIKKFVEERELTLLFLLDTSRSLRHGTRARAPRQAAAELCACLAFAAMRSGDKVGLLLCAEAPEKFIPPRKGGQHAMRVVREVLSAPAEARASRLEQGVELLGRVLRRRAVVFVLSDFHFPLEGLERPLARLARRHDVIGAHLLDPSDLELPRAGLLELADSETGRTLRVDASSPRVRRAWREQGERRVEAVARTLRRIGADRMLVRLEEPVATPLLRLFSERRRPR